MRLLTCMLVALLCLSPMVAMGQEVQTTSTVSATQYPVTEQHILGLEKPVEYGLDAELSLTPIPEPSPCAKYSVIWRAYTYNSETGEAEPRRVKEFIDPVTKELKASLLAGVKPAKIHVEACVTYL